MRSVFSQLDRHQPRTEVRDLLVDVALHPLVFTTDGAQQGITNTSNHAPGE